MHDFMLTSLELSGAVTGCKPVERELLCDWLPPYFRKSSMTEMFSMSSETRQSRVVEGYLNFSVHAV